MSTLTGETPGKAGRPPCCSLELAERIHKLRDSGFSLRQIQDVLNAEGVSTPTGRPYWWKSSVDRILKTKYMRELEEKADVEIKDLTSNNVREDRPVGGMQGTGGRVQRSGSSCP